MALALPWRSERTLEPRTPPRGQQTSLALKPLVRSLERAARPHVLDLGPACGGNLAFFSRRRAKMSIADLYRCLLRARAVEQSEPVVSPLDEVLPKSPSSPVDAVLAWDLLDYLKPEEIARLMKSVARLSKPGALVLAFTTLRREMPSRPQRYTIVDEEMVSYEAESQRKRPSPLYPEPLLLRLMPGTTVESRFQLRNAMTEYLFSCGVSS